MGQGLRRRPGHADRAGPGRAAAGPAACAGRRLPRRGARGRDGRRVRLLPARQGRRGAVDRHRHARPGRRRARRPPAPRLRDRARDRRRRGGADPRVLRRPGGVGAVAAARASSSAWTSPRSRRRTRRRSAASSAGTASPRGATPASEAEAQLAGDHRAPRESSSPRTGPPSRSARSCRATSRCPRRERRAKAAALVPDDPRPRLDRPAAGRALHRHATWCWSSSSREKLRRAGRAGHLLPGPLPAHQGQAAGARPARRPRPSRRSSPGCAELHEAYRADYRGLLRRARHARTRPPMRGADPAIVLVPGVGMFSFGEDKQTARVAGEFYVNAINVMRGAESVSHLRPDRRGGEVPHRVLGAGGGQARTDAEAQAAGHPGRARHRRRLRASARRSPTGSPPRARCVVVADLDLDSAAGGRRRARRTRTSRSRCGANVDRRGRGRGGRATRPCSPSAGSTWSSTTPGCRISKPLLETTVAGLGPAARRDGQGLVPGLPRGGRG